MAVGAIDYLVEAGIFQENSEPSLQPFLIIGVDATDVGIDAMKKGLMYGTVLNDAKSQSQAISSLLDYIIEDSDISQFPYPFTNDRYIYVKGKIIDNPEDDLKS
jgi:methyl-galactoside transport system substrate-binding protein